MTTHTRRFRASSLALSIASAVLLSQGAQAQEELEEIQVTGTRIRTTDGMVMPTPVTSVTPSEISDFDPGTSVSEQLDNLPQFLNTQTAQRGGATLFGDAAGSYLNLRNMGKQRTLVLFDGSRVVPADRSSSVNVDNFPTALIRSVDVVTGGASAAYGADALAGVVNFVLDREFEGFKASASTGVTEFGDGENWNFSVAGGRQFGRVNLIGSVEAREVNEIRRTPQDLDNWASWGWVINPAWSPSDPPGTNPQRLTVPHAHSAIQHPAGMIRAPGFSLDGYVITDDGENVRPFIQGDIPARTGAGSNGIQSGGPEATYFEHAFDGGPSGAEVVQRSGFGAIRYEISDQTFLFAQGMAGRTESNTHNGIPGMEMGQQYYATIYLDNAFMPETLRQAMIAEGLDSVQFHKLGQVRGSPGINNIYTGRDDKNISQMWSGALGFDHTFDNDWNLRGSYQYGESKLTSAAYNILRIDRLAMAMDAVRDPATGAIRCNIQVVNPSPAELAASVEGVMVPTTNIIQYPDGVRPIDSPFVNDNAIRDCVPVNVFGIGNATDAGRDFVLDDKKGIRDLDQDFAELLLTGIVHEGWGPGPLSFAAGLTYREQSFNQFTQPIEMERGVVNAPEVGFRGMAPGTTGGNRSHHYFSATSWAAGEFDVWEWFGELNVPVWESGAGQRLDANIAFRQSDYSLSGKIDSWKVGAEVQIVDDLRFRATKSRDVREPTFGEQFEATGGGANIQDPQNAGISYTITQLAGGNPNLRPEEADTLTAGFVWAPTFADWLNGFQVSVDWYEIDVDGRVGSLGGQRIIDDCQAGDTALCQLIFRNEATGLIERVLNVNLNVAAARTSGVDIEARYNFEPDFFGSEIENLSFRFLAGKLNENSVTTAVYRDDVGSQASPEWTAVGTLGYDVGPWGVRLIGRYFDSTLNNVLWVEGVDVDDNTIASQTVANLVLQYRGETAAGADWGVSFNVNNLFDREPPIIPSQSQRGGQQGVGNNFDVFGRRYQLSFNYSF